MQASANAQICSAAQEALGRPRGRRRAGHTVSPQLVIIRIVHKVHKNMQSETAGRKNVTVHVASRHDNQHVHK